MGLGWPNPGAPRTIGQGCLTPKQALACAGAQSRLWPDRPPCPLNNGMQHDEWDLTTNPNFTSNQSS